MYIFINENEIVPYRGEILKRYAGKRLVKVIANPTNEDLREFGYKTLDEGERPEEREGYRIVPKYTDGDVITVSYDYEKIQEEEE